jgi:hypothetical protein
MLDEDWDKSGEMIAGEMTVLALLNVPAHTKAIALAHACFD